MHIFRKIEHYKRFLYLGHILIAIESDIHEDPKILTNTIRITKWCLYRADSDGPVMEGTGGQTVGGGAQVGRRSVIRCLLTVQSHYVFHMFSLL